MRNNFISLLKEQPNQNFGNQNTKINIHIPIRGAMNDFCIELNSSIRKITSSGIDFSPASFHIPHITLYMGFLTNEINYNRTMAAVYEFSKEQTPFEIFPTLPYLKDPKNNYIFIDTDQTQLIVDLKRNLKSKVEKFIDPLNWDVVEETPHITVGYIKNQFADIAELLNDGELGPSFYADAIEVSFGGPWGSCLGTIRTFEFGS